MFKLLKNRKVWMSGGLVLFLGLSVYVFHNAFYPPTLFRTMQDDIASTKVLDLRGLREMKVSGGSTLNVADLQKKLDHIEQPKLIIDARNETPFYVSGYPATFYRYGQPGARPKHFLRRLYYTGTLFERPDLMVPAADEVKKYGFNYASVFIGSRFMAQATDIDKLIALLDSLPQDTWIHFYCHHGAGRTTMLLTMLDIIRNAPIVTLDDIVKRQHLLGGVDLFDTTIWTNGNYSKKQLEDRKKFIEDFYAFIVQRKAGGIQLWSEFSLQSLGINE